MTVSTVNDREYSKMTVSTVNDREYSKMTVSTVYDRGYPKVNGKSCRGPISIFSTAIDAARRARSAGSAVSTGSFFVFE
jgi:hypothetical protein